MSNVSSKELLQLLKETLQCLEAHLDESCRDHNIKHRDLLCPCNQTIVTKAKSAIAKAEREVTTNAKDGN